MRKNRHFEQAKQFHTALRSKGLTWKADDSVIADWAEHFSDLEDEGVSRKRLTRVLDWYCDKGVGALFVPLVGTAETFCNKFDQIDDARIRLKGQQMQYFDDLKDFYLEDCDNERERCLAKVAQTVQFVDDLAHHRVKLPRNTKVGKTKLKKPMTVYLVFNRQVADLMDWSRGRQPNPELDLAFAKYLNEQGWFRKVNQTFRRRKRRVG